MATQRSSFDADKPAKRSSFDGDSKATKRVSFDDGDKPPGHGVGSSSSGLGGSAKQHGSPSPGFEFEEHGHTLSAMQGRGLHKELKVHKLHVAGFDGDDAIEAGASSSVLNPAGRLTWYTNPFSQLRIST